LPDLSKLSKFHLLLGFQINIILEFSDREDQKEFFAF